MISALCTLLHEDGAGMPGMWVCVCLSVRTSVCERGKDTVIQWVCVYVCERAREH